MDPVSSILKKGKKSTSAFVQGVCSSNGKKELVNEIFERILDPNLGIDEWDTIDWCRSMLAGGHNPDEFQAMVRRYDQETTCGLVWTANFVAYRCRTCGISPCMSLCSECFQHGDHQGHDFNMFRSQAGGACDCGDNSVMRESGFCAKHVRRGGHEMMEAVVVPPDLVCVPQAFMPRLFLRLLQHLRDFAEPDGPVDKWHNALPIADNFLTLLQTQSELGAAMRDVMTRALTNPQVYGSLTLECVDDEPSARKTYKVGNLAKYLQARKLLEGFTVRFEDSALFCNLHELKDKSCFLDELVFWTIYYEFPQKLVCLLLNLMTNLSYKETFTKIFVGHYCRISRMLSKSKDSDTLSNRVVHVSVQLFSNERLALLMAREHGLLQTMVDSVYMMMISIATKSTLQDEEANTHLVVDCGNHIMKEHCYWPLVSDINNILTHSLVAHEFLSNAKLIQQWFYFLSLFQGMNVNMRELKAHVEFESNTYYAAFSAELEASATPMWALIAHLKDESSLDKTKELLSVCRSVLEKWFTSINFSLNVEINAMQVSFHLPLHRCFASFLGQAVRHQGASLESLLPPDDTLKLMMMHPLQAQVSFHEILCNMWVRSGLQIKGQAMTYIQCHFCNSVVDADIFLLQLCAMRLPPDFFLQTLFKRFHVWEWFTFQADSGNSFLDGDKVFPMLEGALSFLIMLLSIHSNIGLTEEQVIRQEMVSLLCMNDRTHSQLMDLLPDKCGETAQNKNFENVLNQVADYRAPNFEAGGMMLQGTYVPKAEIWEKEFNPIHVLLRSVHRREYQSSLDRYSTFCRQNNKTTSTGTLWPPFRVPPPITERFIDPRRVLHCKTMHAIIFTILYRAVNDPDIPEQVLYYCVHLLDMAVRFPSEDDSSVPPEQGEGIEAEDLKFEQWFESNDTMCNIFQIISRILMPCKPPEGVVEEMEIDSDSSFEIMEEYSVYDVHSPVMEEDYVETTPLIPSESHLALPSTSPQPSPAASSSATQLVPYPPDEMLAVSSTSVAPDPEDMPPTSQPLMLPPVGTMVAQPPLFSNYLRRKMAHRKDNRVAYIGESSQPKAIGYPETDPKPSSSKQMSDVQESIVSLLLQLHSKISEKPDSYKPRAGQSREKLDSRIGGRALVIGRILDVVVGSSEERLAAVQEMRVKVWPMKFDEPAESSECMNKEARRRKVRERQQKLMAEFASKQKAFMQKTMESEVNEGASGSDESLPEVKKEYECVICSQMSASEEDRPVGMVVLLQATSVPGHYHEEMERELDCVLDVHDPADIVYVPENPRTKANAVKNTIDFYMRNFDKSQAPMAMNIGFEGGVHVQSCGHYLHIDCHKAYVQSLKGQNQMSSRLQNLAVDQGEYFCPLCRQLANSVIPLQPDIKENSLVASHGRNLQLEILELLATPHSERDAEMLLRYRGNIMEDLTNATQPQYRSVSDPTYSTLILFVCSIIRTNLEVELIQRNLPHETWKKKSSFIPLLNALSLHSCLVIKTIDKNTIVDYVSKVWERLIGCNPADPHSLAFFSVDVPLLLRDPIAILIQIVLTISTRLEKAHFKCIVQVLYNFVYVQGLLQMACRFNSEQRLDVGHRCYLLEKTKNTTNVADRETSLEVLFNEWELVMDLVVKLFDQMVDHFVDYSSPIEKDAYALEMGPLPLPAEEIEKRVEEYCLHFLEVACLLQSHLYDEDLQNKISGNKFHYYCHFLGLENVHDPESGICSNTSAGYIKWPVADPKLLVQTWLDDYGNFYARDNLVARSLLMQPARWHGPALLRLPANYDTVFMAYHRRHCLRCHLQPKDPSICLVCGDMVCLRENCCRKNSLFEACLHALKCGAGTAIYLAINSSTIIVIRGKRACLWGSVYLDCYGEEDRDLKRGKPLFLSQERYGLLQQQWLNHSFDHTNKRWVWHKDNL